MPRAVKSTPKVKLNRSQAVRDYLSQNPGANPGAIKAALKAKGIEISLSLANAIKYAKKKRSTRATGKSIGGKRSAGNKSQAVRDYLAQNPGASPAAVQAALKAKGIKISVSLASAIKYAKKKGSAKSTGRPVGRPPAAARNGSLRAEDLLEAKRFVDRVGGVGAARKALDLLAQLS